MPPVFLDARDLAEQLGVRYNTLLTWVRRGKLPYIRDGRGRYLFNLNLVTEALSPKRVNGVKAAGKAGGS